MVRYTEYPVVKHNSWENVAKENTLHEWLLSQEKGSRHTAPESVKGFTATTISADSISFSWDSSVDSVNSSNQVWYYQLHNSDSMIAEIDADDTTYTIPAGRNDEAIYYLIAVNYFFQKSAPSEAA